MKALILPHKNIQKIYSPLQVKHDMGNAVDLLVKENAQDPSNSKTENATP